MRRNILTLLVTAIAILIVAPVNAKNFLEEEAGICAYTNAGRTIDLARVKPVYRTIEHETKDYVIGSVEITGYPETEDAHVYVHKDGWVAAYYLKEEPVAKIIDWKNYKGAITSTKLDLALLKVSNAMGFPLVSVKYYDFVAPQANQILIVADRQVEGGTNTFNIMIPFDIVVYDRSWGVYQSGGTMSLHIDGNQISSLELNNLWAYGKFTPDQLRQDVFHTVKVTNNYNGTWCAGGIALIYQQP